MKSTKANTSVYPTNKNAPSKGKVKAVTAPPKLQAARSFREGKGGGKKGAY